MPLTPEQILGIIQRADDPTVPQKVKDQDMTLLNAECDQVLAEVSEMVDKYADQVSQILDKDGMTVDRSESLLATYIYVMQVPCGHIHNMFVVAVHKLVEARKALERTTIEREVSR